MGIKPIKRVNVGEQVLLQLKKMLIDGEWAPGSKIPSENELAELFEVSRITVRQALQKLNALKQGLGMVHMSGILISEIA